MPCDAMCLLGQVEVSEDDINLKRHIWIYDDLRLRISASRSKTCKQNHGLS
jgi:hypothetical protein